MSTRAPSRIEWETPLGGRLEEGERSRPFHAARSEKRDTWVWLDGRTYRIPDSVDQPGDPPGESGADRAEEGARRGRGAGSAAAEPRAPIPGKIVRVAVKAGDAVEPGSLLAAISAMKMEHEIRAEARGRVAEVFVVEGAQIEAGDRIARLEIEDRAGASEKSSRGRSGPARPRDQGKGR